MPHYISVVLPCKNNSAECMTIRFPFEGYEFLMETRNDGRYLWDETQSTLYDTVSQTYIDIDVERLSPLSISTLNI